MLDELKIGPYRFWNRECAMDYFGSQLFSLPIGVPFADADKPNDGDGPDRDAMLRLFGEHPDWKQLSNGMVPAHFQVDYDSNNGDRAYIAVFRRGSNAMFSYVPCFQEKKETVDWDELFES